MDSQTGTYGTATALNFWYSTSDTLYGEAYVPSSLSAYNTVQVFTAGQSSITISASDLSGSITINRSLSSSLAANTYSLTLAPTLALSGSVTVFRTGVAKNFTVNRLALDAAIASANHTYGNSVSAGSLSFTNKVGSDDVTGSVVSIVSPDYSSSNNLKVGTYKQSVTDVLSGADAGNYTLVGGFTTATNNYTVNTLALNAAIATANSTYGSSVSAGSFSFTNNVSGDDLTGSTVSIVSPLYSTSNNLKAGTYNQRVTSTLDGTDAANYTLDGG